MTIAEMLGVRPGVTCLVGSGGKTTLAHRLAEAVPGTAIFCTTTHIYPSGTMPYDPGDDPGRLRALLDEHRAVCIGTQVERGKLTAPEIGFDVLRTLADYVLVEADGSRRLPIKAHLAHEPVLPPERDRTILVVGASGFFRPIGEAAHRAERFAELAGAGLGDPVTPARVAAVLTREGGFDLVVVNQVTDERRLDAARALAARLEVPVFAGEVREDRLVRLEASR